MNSKIQEWNNAKAEFVRLVGAAQKARSIASQEIMRGCGQTIEYSKPKADLVESITYWTSGYGFDRTTVVWDFIVKGMDLPDPSRNWSGITLGTLNLINKELAPLDSVNLWVEAWAANQ
mgnify:CR=1 FL=1